MNLKNDNSVFESLFPFFAGFFVGALLTSILWALNVSDIKERAVRSGVAEWRVDTRGNTEFYFKNLPKGKE